MAAEREKAAKEGGMVKVRVPSWINGFHYGYSSSSSQLTRQLSNTILAIVHATGTKIDHEYLYGNPAYVELLDHKWCSSDEHHREGYLVPRAILPVIRNLVEQIEAVVQDAVTHGHSQGRNLLTSLATGEVNVDQFNQATIRGQNRYED